MTRKDKMMKNKIIKSAIAIAAVLTLSVGVSAAQIAFDTRSLNTDAGTATIRGGLYTTSSNPDFSHMADTTTTISIGDGRTKEIMARVVGSPAVYESRVKYVEVDAYGNTSVSSHEASSDIDIVSFNVPAD